MTYKNLCQGPKRVRALGVSVESLTKLLTVNNKIHAEVIRGLPDDEDLKIVEIHTDRVFKTFWIIVEHKSFPMVNSMENIPVIETEINTLAWPSQKAS